MLRTAPRWLQALLVGRVVSSAGALAWIYLTLWLVDERGLSPARAGAITALYGVGTITGNLTGGALGDRFGHRPALQAALLGWAVTCAAFPLAPSSWLGPLALLAGMTGGFGRPLMGALVATALPADRRREGFALFRAASNLGVALGPPLGGLLAATRFDLVFVIDAVTSLVLLVVVTRWCPHVRPQRRPDRPTSLVRALRADRSMVTLLVSVIAVDTTYRLLYTVVPLFLVARGAPPVVYGLTLTLNCALIVLLEPRIARRLSARDAVPVIAAGYALVAGGWLLLGTAPAVATVFLAVLVITAGEMLYKPTATARAADLSPPGMEGRYQSLYAGASIGGMLLSPLLGVALYDRLPGLVWFAAGALALAASGLLVRLDRHRENELPVSTPARGDSPL